MPTLKPRFIIHTPSFEERSGEEAMLHPFVMRCAGYFGFPPLDLGTGRTNADAAPVSPCKAVPSI